MQLKIRRIKLALHVALFALLWGSSALCEAENSIPYGRQDSLGIRVYTLEKVRVIAYRPQESIGSVKVIDPEQAGSGLPANVKEVLQNNAGISVTTGTKNESNLRIRGFRKNEVKILVDGRPLNAGYFGNIDLQNLPLSELSEVIIVKGPASSRYGNNTLGGVVNLITKEPSEKNWLKLGLSARRNNTNQIEMSVAHSFDLWNFWLYGSREHTDGMVLPADFTPTPSENGDVRNNDGKTLYNLQAKSSWELMDLHRVGLTLGYTSIAKKMIPASIYELDDFRLYKDWERYQGTLMGEFMLSEELSLNSMLYCDGGGDTYEQYNDPQYQYLSVSSIMKSKTLGLSLTADWDQGGRFRLSSGYNLDLQYATRKDNGDYQDWTPHQVYLQNIHLQARQQATAKLSFTGSLGVSLSGGDRRNGIIGSLEPGLGMYYTLPIGTDVSLATGINTSYPTMRQLFSAERGNPDLKPQSGIKTELAVSQPLVLKQLSGSVSINAYLNQVRNLIDLVDERYENVNAVDSYGMETELSLRPHSSLELKAVYAWLDYTSGSDYILTESPHHSVDLQTILHLPYQIKMALNSGYRDVRLSQDGENAFHSLPAYWVHSVFLSRDFNRYKLKCGVENLTDNYFEEEYGYPAAGRNFAVKLEINI
jgi:iron complex outermembrane receptor protein